MYLYCIIDFDFFLIDCCFKGCSNGLKFEKTSEQSKNNLPVSGTPAFRISPVSWTPAIFFNKNVLQFPGILDTGISHFTGVLDTGNLQFLVSRTPGNCS